MGHVVVLLAALAALSPAGSPRGLVLPCLFSEGKSRISLRANETCVKFGQAVNRDAGTDVSLLSLRSKSARSAKQGVAVAVGILGENMRSLLPRRRRTKRLV